MTNYSADFWYCHETDPQPIRTHCQMISPAVSEPAVLAEAHRMETQGYIIQKIVLRTLCPTCEGNGRIARRPKGCRKRNLPAWMLHYSDCPTCQGDTWIDSAIVVSA
jgi:hypothetical protein